MSEKDFEVLVDHEGRPIRLTDERWDHILNHPEMEGQRSRLVETLAAPDAVITTAKDETVHTYHKHYDRTPVTEKYLVVAVKMLEDDAFILTAYFTSKLKKGRVVWKR